MIAGCVLIIPQADRFSAGLMETLHLSNGHASRGTCSPRLEALVRGEPHPEELGTDS